MENFFLALADKTRLRILNLIGDDEVCVCFFTEALQEPQPKISRHLAYLRRAGIVETRREGKWIFYRIVQPKADAAMRVLDEIQAWMLTDVQMQKDRERLTQVCCVPEMMPVSIQRAPRVPASSVIANYQQAPSANKENYSRVSQEKELEDFLL